ncbi:hypothetical protein W02_30550 [Nitrospira sp. KM1]|nr:hypothetical protein W02_30550 [Nitrospira sp. KM1]
MSAEVKSSSVDPADADTAFLFGDGAGAVVVRAESGPDQQTQGVLGIRLYADGGRHNLIHIAAGGSRNRATVAAIQANEHKIRMEGGPLFRLAVRKLEQAIRDILKEFGVGLDDIAQILLHQANGRILSCLTERLGVSASKVCSVIERYGNTSSASLPIALDHAVRNGNVHEGDVVLLGSFGGGITWAAGLVKW